MEESQMRFVLRHHEQVQTQDSTTCTRRAGDQSEIHLILSRKKKKKSSHWGKHKTFFL